MKAVVSIGKSAGLVKSFQHLKKILIEIIKVFPAFHGSENEGFANMWDFKIQLIHNEIHLGYELLSCFSYKIVITSKKISNSLLLLFHYIRHVYVTSISFELLTSDSDWLFLCLSRGSQVNATIFLLMIVLLEMNSAIYVF